MRSENIVQQAIERGYRVCFIWETQQRFPDCPPGTRSTMLGFIDPEGRLRICAHCLLLPDGRLGAAGLLDPTMLLLDDGRALKWNQQP